MDESKLDYLCPKHDEPLQNVLQGGAGWCPKCRSFVQSANHSMPELPPEAIAKRELAGAAQRAAKKAASRKRGKAVLAAKPSGSTEGAPNQKRNHGRFCGRNRLNPTTFREGESTK